MQAFWRFTGNKGVRFVASLWLGSVVLMLILMVLACGTIYESTHGTEAALAVFYKSSWFAALLGLMGVGVLAALLVRFPFNKARIGFVLTHVSLIVILLGAMVTYFIGVDAQLALVEGQSSSEIRLAGAEQLKITNAQTKVEAAINLPKSISGGVEAVEQPRGAAVALEDVQVSVSRYLPDSEVSAVVVNDSSAAKAAIELSLSGTGNDQPVWLFAGETARVGGMPVAFTVAADAADLQNRLVPSAAEGESIGSMKVTVGAESFEFGVENCQSQACPLGQSGYSVKVIEYFPHATVGQGGAVVNTSPEPRNPAIRAEISGPGGTHSQLAFANFPDFRSTHGGAAADEVKLTFVASGKAAAAAAPIEIITAPGTGAYAKFTNAGQTTTRELAIGQSVETPWPNVKLTLRQSLDRARVAESLVAPAQKREGRIPGLTLQIQTGDTITENWVQKGEPRTIVAGTQAYTLEYRDQAKPLGFNVTLNKFTVGYYPGGRRPRSFESQITITDPATGVSSNRLVSMNHPTSFNGYTFYQSSYQLMGDKAMSVLSVAKDPGQPVVFAGYFGLMGGMLWVVITRMRASRAAGGGNGRADQGAKRNGSRTIPLVVPGDRCQTGVFPKEPVTAGAGAGSRRGGGIMNSSNLLALGAALLIASSSASASELPDTLDLSAIRRLCVQHDGRYMPLDTVARDYVESITGKEHFGDRDEVLWLLAWTFEPQIWADHPLISIRNAELRHEIGLPAEQMVFSFNDLVRHERFRKLVADLANVPKGRKLDPLESKVSGIHEQLIQLQTVFQGQAILPIPNAADSLAAWAPIVQGGMGQGQAAPQEVTEAWFALRAAYLADNAADFSAAANQLITATAALPAAFRPTPAQLAAELRYNAAAPFSNAWKIMALGAVLACAAMFIKRHWFDALAMLGLVGGFAAVSYGLWLRWHIAGRIPASNMYESLLFLGWGVGLFAILSIFLFRDRLVPLTASIMAALSLFLADVLPVDHFIRPIAPVLLDTVWMSIHVPVIMVSYSVLALAVLIAHVQLVAMAASPKSTVLIATVDRLHYWYILVGALLLTAGIITGSMWAASSWGRYWGWDPKEVWSLVALLGYLTILHVRFDIERVPAWGCAVGLVLMLAVFVLMLAKLAPVTPAKFLALGGAMGGIAFMVLGRGLFATAAKSILCFWLIIMTYVGVNFVLGIGLHSYGFGTGAVAKYMFQLGAADLAFLALCSVVYVIRRGVTGKSHGAPAHAQLSAAGF